MFGPLAKLSSTFNFRRQEQIKDEVKKYAYGPGPTYGSPHLVQFHGNCLGIKPDLFDGIPPNALTVYYGPDKIISNAKIEYVNHDREESTGFHEYQISFDGGMFTCTLNAQGFIIGMSINMRFVADPGLAIPAMWVEYKGDERKCVNDYRIELTYNV